MTDKKQKITPVTYVYGGEVHPSNDECWREGCGNINEAYNTHRRWDHPNNLACTQGGCLCQAFVGALDDIGTP